MQVSVVVVRGLSSCGSGALECRLSGCGAQAYLLRGTWDLHGPGIEPVSPALAGGFLTTAPPGMSHFPTFLETRLFYQYILEAFCQIQALDRVTTSQVISFIL